MPQQRLDGEVLSGPHNWTVVPERDPSYHTLFEDNSNPRTDMRRYMAISTIESEKAKICFSKLCKSGTLFRVPSTLVCDRTFARDEEGAYYLDKMDQYLARTPEDLDAKDIPLLQRSFAKRLFAQFGRRSGYHRDLYNRKQVGIWHVFDAYENEHFSSASLSELYPVAEEWLTEVAQPPALPIPTPLVLYYYHSELRKAQIDRANRVQISERARRLLFCLEHEHYVLTLMGWWKESYFGGRQYIFTLRSIEILEQKCDSVSDIDGKPARAIAEYMRIARLQPSAFHNWMTFEYDSMEDSTFIWSLVEVGVFDAEEPARRQLFCSGFQHKITTTRFSCALFRRSGVLDRKFPRPALDRVPGLKRIADDQGWSTLGEIKVYDVLKNLVQLYYSTAGLMNTVLGDAIRSQRYTNEGRCMRDRPSQGRDSSDRDNVPRLEYEHSYDYDRSTDYHGANGYDHGYSARANVPRLEYERLYDHDRSSDYPRANDYNRQIDYDRDRDVHMQDGREEFYGRNSNYDVNHRRDRETYRSDYDGRPQYRDDYYRRGDIGRAAYRDLDNPGLDYGNDGDDSRPQCQNNLPVHVDVLTDGGRTPTMVGDPGAGPSSKKVVSQNSRDDSAVRTPMTPLRPVRVTSNGKVIRETVSADLLERIRRATREHPPLLITQGERRRTPRLPSLPEGEMTTQEPVHATNEETSAEDPVDNTPLLSSSEYTKQGSGNVPWGIMTRSQKKRVSGDMAEQPDGEEKAGKKPRLSEGQDVTDATVRSSAEDAGNDSTLANLKARHDIWTAQTLYVEQRKKSTPEK